MKALCCLQLSLCIGVLLLAGCASQLGQQNTSATTSKPSILGNATPAAPSHNTVQPPTEASAPITLATQSSPDALSAPASSNSVPAERGLASWYGPRFHGKRTASGERFNTQAMTAAHKTLPFGTQVRVKSLSTGKEVVVRINDRGPFIKGRIIDLSNAAAKALGFRGVQQVEIARL